PGSQTVVPGDYPFTVGDAGVHTFSNGVKLTKTPSQTISVANTEASTATTVWGWMTVNPGTIYHFSVTAPASTTAGNTFSTTVTAFDASTTTKTDYLSLHDALPIYPGSQTVVPGDYPFTVGDAGVHTFSNGVKLTKTPSQTI